MKLYEVLSVMDDNERITLDYYYNNDFRYVTTLVDSLSDELDNDEKLNVLHRDIVDIYRSNIYSSIVLKLSNAE